MRRLLMPALAAALLATAASSPVHAEGWKEFKDCLSFTLRWCKEARAGANFLEEMAVDAACVVLMAGCADEL